MAKTCALLKSYSIWEISVRWLMVMETEHVNKDKFETPPCITADDIPHVDKGFDNPSFD